MRDTCVIHIPRTIDIPTYKAIGGDEEHIITTHAVIHHFGRSSGTRGHQVHDAVLPLIHIPCTVRVLWHECIRGIEEHPAAIAGDSTIERKGPGVFFLRVLKM